MAKRRSSSLPSTLGVLIIIAGLGLGYYLYQGYGTLEPCGMLQAEVKIRLLDGRIDTLGDIPKLIVNNGDQVWCSKEFIIAHLP